MNILPHGGKELWWYFVFAHNRFHSGMEHRDDDGTLGGLKDQLAYAHFEEAHREVWGLVDSCFGEDVHPAAVWRIKESDGVVHGRLVYSSWSVWHMSVNGQCIPQAEE
jgi:hypothetical protein